MVDYLITLITHRCQCMTQNTSKYENKSSTTVFISIQFISCSSDPKWGYDPQDTEHVNSVTSLVYIMICTKQTIK
jgi:hypothetical protein